MGLEILIHKCKKEDYLRRKDNPDAVNWMCFEASCKAFGISLSNSLRPKITQEQQKEHSCQHITTLYGSHLYNWLIHNTDVSLDRAERVVFEKDAISKLKDICELIYAKTVEEEHFNNEDLCRKLLPIPEGYCFSSGDEYDDFYLDCVYYALELLSGLLEHVDFENELVLVMADW